MQDLAARARRFPLVSVTVGPWHAPDSIFLEAAILRVTDIGGKPAMVIIRPHRLGEHQPAPVKHTFAGIIRAELEDERPRSFRYRITTGTHTLHVIGTPSKSQDAIGAEFDAELAARGMTRETFDR